MNNPNLKKPRLDLTYGNPSFLQEVWAYQKDYTIDFKIKSMPYKLGKTADPDLEKNIKEIHKKYKNCKITKKSQIVVTVGAVQALQAAMYAYRKIYGPRYLYSPRPYWGRFQEFAASQQMTMCDWLSTDSEPDKNLKAIAKNDHGKTVITLITTPNNPDGELYSKYKADIRDACYNWPQYTKKPVLLGDDVVIFSLSKLSGHSSTRLGWAVVRNPQIATLMQEYVELFSSGVSIESQTQAAMVLSNLLEGSPESFFKLGRVKLAARNLILKDLVKKHKLPIKILSKDGMFWYIECRPQVVFDLKVNCFAGSACGDLKKDRFRFNIGCSTEDFEDLCVRLENLSKIYND
jgi:aspartate/methionine/tyrosine aminotransferase